MSLHLPSYSGTNTKYTLQMKQQLANLSNGSGHLLISNFIRKQISLYIIMITVSVYGNNHTVELVSHQKKVKYAVVINAPSEKYVKPYFI